MNTNTTCKIHGANCQTALRCSTEAAQDAAAEKRYQARMAANCAAGKHYFGADRLLDNGQRVIVCFHCGTQN